MSQKEADRLPIISPIGDKTVTVAKEAELMSISPRQVDSILKTITEEGSSQF
jgi:Mn-dependent DtxR family transcriptional regulator